MKNFKGYLQSDGHPIYDAFEDGEDVCLCGCLAHIRRHIELCKEENLEYAMQGLKFIQDMYNVEYIILYIYRFVAFVESLAIRPLNNSKYFSFNSTLRNEF